MVVPQNREMETASNNSDEKIDSGLTCLVTAAQLIGVPADYQQLKRAFVVANTAVDTVTLLRAAGELGLKAKQTQTAVTKLQKLALPAIALLGNGQILFKR